MNNHEIDYKIYGDDIQYVEIELDPNETVISEAGSMMMINPSIQMETIFGDGASSGGSGFMDKLFAAGKRTLTGESLFMTTFTNRGSGKEHVYLAAPYPGKIIPIDLSRVGGEFICQKDAFLGAAKGVSVGIAIQKKIGVGFFGGEGFIMQRLSGDGMAFIHAGGAIIKKDLRAGEVLQVDTGCLVGMTSSVNYDLERVPGIKTKMFGGEGIWFARLEGPGTVYIQSLPFSRLASRVFAAAPATGTNRGEGSSLGGFFDLLSGDN